VLLTVEDQPNRLNTLPSGPNAVVAMWDESIFAMAIATMITSTHEGGPSERVIAETLTGAFCNDKSASQL